MPFAAPKHRITNTALRHEMPIVDNIHKFYTSPAWRKLRLLILKEQPLCQYCFREGILTEAKLVDHVIPISQGGAKLDRRNLLSSCNSCHNKKRATVDKLRT